MSRIVKPSMITSHEMNRMNFALRQGELVVEIVFREEEPVRTRLRRATTQEKADKVITSLVQLKPGEA